MEDDKPKLTLAKSDCPTCGNTVLKSELIPAGDQTVCPGCRDSYLQSLKEGVRNPALDTNSRGTGGATPNVELRAMARDALSGRWLQAAGVIFLYMLIGTGTAFIPILGTIAQFFVGAPLLLGLSIYFLGIARGEQVGVSHLFDGFSFYWKSIGIYFVITVIATLVIIAAAVPIAIIIGFVSATGTQTETISPLVAVAFLVTFVSVFFVSAYIYLRYSLVYFLVKDNPEIGVFEALRVSSQRMYGHKKKLFGLFLSFIPWAILSILTLFVGLLWVWAYSMAAFAAFYDDLGEEA